MDDSDNSMGWKCAEYEMKGVPLRVECGPRDLENGQCVLVRRNNGEKTVVKLEELETAVAQHAGAGARRHVRARPRRTWTSTSMRLTLWRRPRNFRRQNGGFVKTMWCGSLECEMKMKEVAGMSSRCIPFAQEKLDDRLRLLRQARGQDDLLGHCLLILERYRQKMSLRTSPQTGVAIPRLL